LPPPADGDHSSGEQALVAQVIPLRRRGVHAELRHEEPAHSGVFDPPPEPEPPEEYSVWECPTAELIRRIPSHQAPRITSRRLASPHGRRWAIAAAAAVLLCAVAFGVATSGSQRRAQRSAALTRPPEQLGLGSPLAGGSPRSGKQHPYLGVRSSATSRSRRRAGSTHASTPRPVGRSSPSGSPPGAIVTEDTRASEPSEARAGPSAQPETPAQGAVATAAREFGFER
jgi:hypothetical protein